VFASSLPPESGACEIQASLMRRRRKSDLLSKPGRKGAKRQPGAAKVRAAQSALTEQQDEILRRQDVPRRKRVLRRTDVPDAKYKSRNVARFTSKLMLDGKRSLAERIIYDAFEAIEAKQKRPPLDVFEQALKNATPTIEVKPRRVGGSTYQVPVDVRRDRGNALAMRWLIRSARSRNGRTMSEKLASELMDAAAGQGATIKKREETHKMAESNRAFAHYRW
jgi:small subunit ribosomal protein S7